MLGRYFDAETDLFENWHRNMDGFLGRYLSPDPDLSDPLTGLDRSLAGSTMTAYGYASLNPISNVDPDGRYDFDKKQCKGKKLPGKATIKAIAEDIITDRCLLDCILDRAEKAYISCDTLTDFCKRGAQAEAQQGDTCDPEMLSRGGAIGSKVNWCGRETGSIKCRARFMIHEFAHLCGWRHKDCERGVPRCMGPGHADPDQGCESDPK